MSGSFADPASAARTGQLIAGYRRLRQLGFDDPAAANLTAVGMGVPIGRRPWKVGELTHLAFLRELATSHAAWSDADDAAPTDDREDWRLPGRTARIQEWPERRITLLTLLQAAAGQQATLASLASRLALPPSLPPDARQEGG